ncbi:MAG: glycosyltransferase (TIGR04182 family) [Natronomonas sp.]|jgi:dolichol-phosphate mannosyltransferase|uniref:S-layer glycoprotein N-glycosyltransferase AglJ n=1 Tax=Natronomonas sp. TaxID=2184060 RepID=UPI003989365C
MPDRTDVCVLIPTLDEAATVGEVVSGFRDAGFDDVFVIDGGSEDGTRAVAEDHGARVRTQSGAGKGQAVREALNYIEKPYVLMADGDGTYRPEDADAMLEPLFDGRADHVIGDRFADMDPGAMTKLNRVGNRLINRLFAAVHGRALRDILSGYRAFTRESIERFRLEADGFGIETELAAECVRQGVDTHVVPIRYLARPDSSETNLRPLADGGRIVLTLYTLAKTNNPIFYFGSASALGTLAGLSVAGFVAYRYFIVGVSHEVLALLAAFLVLLSVQLLMFGFLTDVLVSVSREQTRQLDEIADRLREIED